MSTNVFFQNYDFFNEQQLIDDLVVESIQMYGIDTYYISRKLVAVDEIMNEDRLSIFDKAYEVDLYVKSVDGFQGDGDFLSKFGLQIRDQATFSIAIRTFERYVTRNTPTIIRPREGDLVYLPFNKKFFKITFVEHESVFYQTGSLQIYDLKCELFEYSNERFETGTTLIDTAFDAYKTSNINTITDLYNIDPIAKNIVYENSANSFIDFTEIDPFSESFALPNDYNPTSDSQRFSADTELVTTDGA